MLLFPPFSICQSQSISAVILNNSHYFSFRIRTNSHFYPRRYPMTPSGSTRTRNLSWNRQCNQSALLSDLSTSSGNPLCLPSVGSHNRTFGFSLTSTPLPISQDAHARILCHLLHKGNRSSSSRRSSSRVFPQYLGDSMVLVAKRTNASSFIHLDTHLSRLNGKLTGKGKRVILASNLPNTRRLQDQYGIKPYPT